MQTAAFDCYSCTASVPDEGKGWPPGWEVCVGFRAGCPECVAAGRAVPIMQAAREPEPDAAAIG